MSHTVPEVNFHFPSWRGERKTRVARSSSGETGWRFRHGLLFKYEGLLDIFLSCIGCSSLSHFSKLQMEKHDLLTFTNSSGWERWHSIKGNTSKYPPSQSWLHRLVLHVNMLLLQSKQQSTFAGSDVFYLSLPFKVYDYSFSCALVKLCRSSTGWPVSPLTLLCSFQAATRGSFLLTCDQGLPLPYKVLDSSQE